MSNNNRTMREQMAGLDLLLKAATRLHRVNLVMREDGGLMEATGYHHAQDTSIVYVTGGYDVWTQGSLTQTDLSLEDAAKVLAEAYMEAKARHVITETWGEKPWRVEAILSDPQKREEFFAQMDASSAVVGQKVAKRHTN